MVDNDLDRRRDLKAADEAMKAERLAIPATSRDWRDMDAALWLQQQQWVELLQRTPPALMGARMAQAQEHYLALLGASNFALVMASRLKNQDRADAT